MANLEGVVLELDDLIGRQRLESLAAMGRLLKDAYEEMKDLLDRYNASQNPALRRELEVRLRELRSQIASLAQKSQPSRAVTRCQPSS